MGGLRSCMGLTGRAYYGRTVERSQKFVRISGAGIQESHVHDVTITKESPQPPHGLLISFRARRYAGRICFTCLGISVNDRQYS